MRAVLRSFLLITCLHLKTHTLFKPSVSERIIAAVINAVDDAVDFPADAAFGSVPDAESFGLLDVEQRRFNLWLVVSLALAVRAPATVDVRILLLKLRGHVETIKLVLEK
ncbi:hypothetical protein F2P81_005310 [Scophthalmus maximus]|uniref:Uncharacterized protein n=1 Tax=Scophthalmus maximus TaxID=52904 RepID=A0A6A4TBL3_SCOMX|nr:hypothetical protein F2P81_005310 [Scophthalmus maximus]